jgi:hypothetical protein
MLRGHRRPRRGSDEELADRGPAACYRPEHPHAGDVRASTVPRGSQPVRRPRGSRLQLLVGAWPVDRLSAIDVEVGLVHHLESVGAVR